MTLLILAYVGGILTIVSPCILPVLPFVFARANQPFVRSGLPLLAGMTITFALVASLAAIAGGWVVEANKIGRVLAMAALVLFGLTLIFPALADRLTSPIVAAGARIAQRSGGPDEASPSTSFLLGIATGFLWAPCAGPILGLILTTAAISGASVQTTLFLAAYAAGAATSLGLALVVGGRVFAAMRRSLGAGEWIRRGLGVAVLAAVAAISLGLDTGYLARLSLASTASLEQSILGRFQEGGATSMQMSPNAMQGASGAMMQAVPSKSASGLPTEGNLPSLAGAVDWINSKPLTAQSLKGKVVLVDFWTYSCINCLRSVPYVRSWAAKYRDQGLVVIGVHAPEFAFEKDVDNVKRAVEDLRIDYPVAVDNDYAIWRGFDNKYWPAHYFIDGQGRIRHHHFGEGDYDESERIIQELLSEIGSQSVAAAPAKVDASGIEAAADMASIGSPETYIGFERAANFASPGGQVERQSHAYESIGSPGLNHWGLEGQWTVEPEHAHLDAPNGRIVFKFHARDLHLVLGPDPSKSPIRFRVTIDGKPPGSDHGVDVNAGGEGVVREERLFQLVRQTGAVTDRVFEIEFLDPGVQAYAFTFG